MTRTQVTPAQATPTQGSLPAVMPAADTSVKPITTARPIARHLEWLDLIKGAAVLWIFLNHLVEQLFGGPYFANPSDQWPNLAVRFAQLTPLSGYGLLDAPLNLLRYVGWAGDQGVQLFLLISGFGLTWGLLRKSPDAPLPLISFYRRRLARIFPMWWGVHLFFAALFFLTGWGVWVGDRNFYFSLLGIRLTPGQLYYFAPAWWYVGLLLQLYLIFPLLWAALRRIGPTRLLILSFTVTVIARAIGLEMFGGYIDPWQRGAIFITQLPSFVAGMTLAWWLQHQPERTTQRLAASGTIALALGAYLLGNVLSFFRLGMAVAPFLSGIGVFILLYNLFTRSFRHSSFGKTALAWMGEHSFPLFLVHQPFILLFVPPNVMMSGQWARAVLGTIAAAGTTGVVGVALEQAVESGEALVQRTVTRQGLGRMLVQLALIVLIGAGLLYLGEFTVRMLAPQEVLGWGERPSLAPDPVVGWHLHPSSQTRLRWLTYDYTVTANSLGYPGPEFPVEKAPGTYRIMVLGDAFSSAEGVDTDQSWPYLFERALRDRLPDRSIEVLNFAITGYGPNQYAAVAQTYAPVYHPDLILIETFVNDYQDVMISDDDFRRSIGFGEPDPFSAFTFVRMMHLRRFLEVQVQPRLVGELLQGIPNADGYFLGNFPALEIDQPDRAEGYDRMGARLREIVRNASRLRAQVAMVMVPASVQVCDASSLTYYPRYVDLSDTTTFDLDLPQRATQSLANALQIPFYDLRPTLDALQSCPYQPSNMHWLPSGHTATAQYLADTFAPQIEAHIAAQLAAQTPLRDTD